MQQKFIWVWVIFAVIVPVLPNLVTQGMFVDGVHYATLARNLSTGDSSIWEPFAGKASWGVLPFMPMLQSIFFLIFGDYYWVEKLFSGFMLLANVLSIVWIWKVSNEVFSLDYLKYAWWPVLVWTLFPSVGYSFSHNLIENLSSLLSLLSCIFVLRAINNSHYVNLYFAIFCIILSFFTKGLVCLFPAIIPFLLHFFSPKMDRKKVIFFYSNLIFVSTLCILIFYVYEPSNIFFRHYLSEQVFSHLRLELSGSDETPIVYFPYTHVSPVRFLIYLFEEFWQPVTFTIAFIGLAYYLGYKKTNDTIKNELNKLSLFFLFIAFSASLPMIISKKFSVFYLMPSNAFFALALAGFSLPYINFICTLLSEKLKKIFLFTGLLLNTIFVIICLSIMGNSLRNQDLNFNINKLKVFVYEENICLSNQLKYEHGIYTNFERYLKVKWNQNNAKFWLGRSEEKPPIGFETEKIDLKGLKLARSLK